MAFNAVTALANRGESRVSHSPVYTGIDELNHYNDPRDHRRDHGNNVWVRVKQMVWDNITHTSTSSGGIADSDSVFNMTTAGSDFSLEVITRAASQVLEVTEIERTIETSATTVSLSVFSQ